MHVLPTHISQYEVRRVLGQGGMGVVYLAFDPGLRRQVALKVLRTDNEEQRERFRREARIAARVQHPNIVAIYAVGEHDGQPYIAMEYIEGEPLSDGIRRRAPWALGRKLLMAADLCAGLAMAHRAGVIHRDVKPSNLIVTNGSGVLRILDFGIARGADLAATMGLTMQGNIVGTLNYMSPEQIAGQPLDHRSDIFAVGLVLYELLTYRQAFAGDNIATLTYRIVHGAAEPIDQLEPDLDTQLCRAVARAMARSPDDRFQHLDEMRSEILRIASRLTPDAAAQIVKRMTAEPMAVQPLVWSKALDPTIDASAPSTPHAVALAPPELETTSAEISRRPAKALMAGAAGVVIAGAVGLYVVRQGAPDDVLPPVERPPVNRPETPKGSTTDAGGGDPLPENTTEPDTPPGPSSTDEMAAQLRDQLSSARALLKQGSLLRAAQAARVPSIPAGVDRNALSASLTGLRDVGVQAATRAAAGARAAERAALAAGASPEQLAPAQNQMTLAAALSRSDAVSAVSVYTQAEGSLTQLRAQLTAPRPPDVGQQGGQPGGQTGGNGAAKGGSGGSGEVGPPVGTVEEKKSDPPPPTPPVNEEELVLSVLTRWAAAYSSRDIGALRAVEPGATDQVARQLDDLRSVRSSLSGCQVSVTGASANAACTERFQAVDRFGNASRPVDRRRSFTLRKSDGRWTIASATLR